MAVRTVCHYVTEYNFTVVSGSLLIAYLQNYCKLFTLLRCDDEYDLETSLLLKNIVLNSEAKNNETSVY